MPPRTQNTSHDFMVTLRNSPRSGDGFGDRTEDEATYLLVPARQSPSSRHRVASQDEWFDSIASRFVARRGAPARGHLLAFIHGYNNKPAGVLARQRMIAQSLAKIKTPGALCGPTGDGESRGPTVIVSFDWPSKGETLKYLSDRGTVEHVAYRLMLDLIKPFVERRTSECEVDVSVLAHSMGGYLLRQAFLAADDHRAVSETNWRISQVVFVGADVSSSSFAPGTRDSDTFQRHCARFTNYFTPFDSALKVSNVKRLGLAARVGRVGLPTSSSSHFIDVDCAARYLRLNRATWRDTGGFGNHSHSWYFGDPVFTKDLAYTLAGDIDRNYIPTRRVKVDDDLELVEGAGR